MVLIFYVLSVFISMKLDGVMSISRFKNLPNTCKASVTVKVLGGISTHIMVENWQHLKDALAFL